MLSDNLDRLRALEQDPAGDEDEIERLVEVIEEGLRANPETFVAAVSGIPISRADSLFWCDIFGVMPDTLYKDAALQRFFLAELDRLLAQLAEDPGNTSIKDAIDLVTEAGFVAQGSSLAQRMRERMRRAIEHPDVVFRAFCIGQMGNLVNADCGRILDRLRKMVETEPDRSVRLAAYRVLEEHTSVESLNGKLPIVDRFILAVQDKWWRL